MKYRSEYLIEGAPNFILGVSIFIKGVPFPGKDYRYFILGTPFYVPGVQYFVLGTPFPRYCYKYSVPGAASVR